MPKIKAKNILDEFEEVDKIIESAYKEYLNEGSNNSAKVKRVIKKKKAVKKKIVKKSAVSKTKKTVNKMKRKVTSGKKKK